MRLNHEFVSCDILDERTLVPTGSALNNYHGVVRCNDTAAFVIDCLKTETTEQEIIRKMAEEYDAPQERIEQGVKRTLETLRSIGALVE